MSDNDNSDNAHEDLQRLIASRITASQTPSDSSNLENRQCKRKKEIKGKSWTCSGMIMIDILDLVPAVEDDQDMPDQSDHCHPLESRLPRIKSSLRTFMQPIFPQESLLLDPFKYFEVLSNVNLSLSLNKVQPFTSTSEHFYNAARRGQTQH